MNLIDNKTNKQLNGVIEQVTKDDLKRIKKDRNFGFNWEIEGDRELYKIRLLKSKEILGLISLIDYQEEFRIHINLVESSKKYRGKDKSILHIPGCLIAYACKLSFKRGYEGFVSLTPKTQLKKYYNKIYGFIPIGIQMAVLEEISEAIIKKYIGDEEI